MYRTRKQIVRATNTAMFRISALVAPLCFLLLHVPCQAQSADCIKIDGLEILVDADIVSDGHALPLYVWLKNSRLHYGDHLVFTYSAPSGVPGARLYYRGYSHDDTPPYEIQAQHDNSLWSAEIRGPGWGGEKEATFIFHCSAWLPIQLSSLVATSNLGAVSLSWQTDSETNNDGFEIQRRGEDGRYEALDFIEGAGTTTSRQDYQYTVENLDFGTHTFRLKQIDLDGGYSYSDEVEVLIEVPDAVATDGAFPNPFNPSTTIRFAVSAEQNVRVSMHDIQGRLVRHVGEIDATPHEMHRIQINGAGLSSGMYLVRLKGEYFSTTEQVTLVR